MTEEGARRLKAAIFARAVMDARGDKTAYSNQSDATRINDLISAKDFLLHHKNSELLHDICIRIGTTPVDLIELCERRLKDEFG